MRCPDCNKFVAYDESNEPEVDLDLTQGNVTGTVRIVLVCAECGTELKETVFDIDKDVLGELQKHVVENHPDEVTGLPGETVINVENFEVDGDSSETIMRTEGKGRGMRTFYGHHTDICIKCTLCDAQIVNWFVEDVCQASAMDELV